MAASKGTRCLLEAMRTLSISSSLAPARQRLPTFKSQILPPASRCRTIATSAAASIPPVVATTPAEAAPARRTPLWTPPTEVPVTIYDFPSLEPLELEAWPTKHLHLPLRRDILHLAVTYEGDRTRQGTASSKTRWDVAGSHRKFRRQKGSGKARVGWRQSPLRRGGGKSHGPHPRDFSTGLNRKVYDLAWRTALSYRYRRGELFVVRDGLDLPLPEDVAALAARNRLPRELHDQYVERMVREVLAPLGWGHDGGRSTFVAAERREGFFDCLDVASGYDARALEVDDVDVKDLLETGRIVIERSALLRLIEEHQSDLVSNIRVNGALVTRGPLAGATTTLVAA
ncbi:hypothetical protein GGTG_07920 [Gaeumannomyces tritici R3-111a-1]|uniref:Large ribosomal subunit protein uL4m n=1 Tax=Gaeumannomyces tritici (strain R3-111a-1) TaxID=644352 RepID=J3P329_GAET3|nr:hypothetical protein GGTG_07920 [Gaeumannomyces tritici R3-111a-1]EJT74071.1 hypothetical protein GGTG_07920 [Gaeumannomyces tritici R3-111a-1]